jgi:hypothetical protein
MELIAKDAKFKWVYDKEGLEKFCISNPYVIIIDIIHVENGNFLIVYKDK